MTIHLQSKMGHPLFFYIRIYVTLVFTLFIWSNQIFCIFGHDQNAENAKSDKADCLFKTYCRLSEQSRTYDTSEVLSYNGTVDELTKNNFNEISEHLKETDKDFFPTQKKLSALDDKLYPENKPKELIEADQSEMSEVSVNLTKTVSDKFINDEDLTIKDLHQLKSEQLPKIDENTRILNELNDTIIEVYLKKDNELAAEKVDCNKKNGTEFIKTLENNLNGFVHKEVNNNTEASVQRVIESSQEIHLSSTKIPAIEEPLNDESINTHLDLEELLDSGEMNLTNKNLNISDAIEKSLQATTTEYVAEFSDSNEEGLDVPIDFDASPSRHLDIESTDEPYQSRNIPRGDIEIDKNLPRFNEDDLLKDLNKKKEPHLGVTPKENLVSMNSNETIQLENLKKSSGHETTKEPLNDSPSVQTDVSQNLETESSTDKKSSSVEIANIKDLNSELLAKLTDFSKDEKGVDDKGKLLNSSMRQPSSLAFIFDSTNSMYDDLVQLKKGAKMILQTMLERDPKPVQNYILVTFRDPEVDSVFVTSDEQEFLSMIDKIYIHGGGDCPEKSLSGISAALNASLPFSYLYVFSDATATDHALVNEVINLVQEKQSQVVFLLTGYCKSRDTPKYRVYEKIASASSGLIFHMQKTDIAKVLRYVKESLDTNRVNLDFVNKPAGVHKHKVVVDDTLEKVTVAVSGNASTLSVRDPSGTDITGPPKLVPVVDLSEIKIVNLIDPDPGNWIVTIGSEDPHSVKVTGLSTLQFDYGFSTNIPQLMSDTFKRPLEATQNILMISVNEDIPLDTISSAELLDVRGETLFELPLEKLEKKPGQPYLFRSDSFLAPDLLFYITVNGVDKAGNSFRRSSNIAVKSSLPDKPKLVVMPKISAFLHEQVILSCSVESMAPISVYWFKDGVPLINKQEHIQSAVVEYTILDMDESTEGTYVCTSSNVAGHVAAKVEIILLVQPPKVEMNPKNVTASSGDILTLECFVESNLQTAVNILFTNETTNLEINKMQNVGDLEKSFRGPATVYSYNFTLSNDTSGTYLCVVTSKAGTSQAQAIVEIRPPLKVQVFPKIVEFQEGSVISFSCTIRGTIIGKWSMINNDVSVAADEMHTDWDEVRVLLDNNTAVQIFLEIKKSQKKHEGTYVCHAYRNEETAEGSVQVSYVEAPSIQIPHKSLLFEIDTVAIIDCEASGIPKPTITWYGLDDDKIPYDTGDTRRVYMNDLDQLVINDVNPVDNGKYTCEAENQMGLVNDTVELKIWKKPYFTEPLENESLNIYDSKVLTCKADGIPPPKITWYFNDALAKEVEISPDGGSDLYLRNVNLNDGGKYTCIAENTYDSTKEEIYIDIVGLEPPVIHKANKTIVLKEGDRFEFYCKYLRGRPYPAMFWEKNGVNLTEHWRAFADEPDSEDFLNKPDKNEGSILELTIDIISYEHEGNYSCVGRNILGEDRYDFTLEVQRPPKFSESGASGDFSDAYRAIVKPLEVVSGKDVTLNCGVTGKPRPLITWSKDGIPVLYTDKIYLDANSSLVIPKVKESDGGMYTCFASNPVGNLNKNFSVDVLVQPTVTNTTTDSMVETVEGQLVVLMCSIHAVPPPQVTWLLNKEPLELSDRVQLDADNTLRFVANLSDSGIYRCDAINKAGNISQEYLVLVFAPPYIYPPGNEVTKVKESTTVVLDCNAVGFPEPKILWSKNGQLLSNESGDFIVTDSGRLTIKEVSLNTSGTFVCEAENLAGLSDKMFRVIVNEAPNMLPSELPVKLQLLAGEDEFNIPCRASGNPTPYITWLKDGKSIINDLHTKVQPDGTLSLRLVTEELSGRYTCMAANTEGSIELDYHVQVVSPPVLKNEEEHNKIVIAAEGTSAVLECPLRPSHVMPTIQWYKNSDLIPQNSSSLRLELANVSRHDSSEYSCLAVNAGGRVSATFKLIVQWPPIFINGITNQSEDVHLLEGEPMKLSCHVDANPAADVQWLKNLEVIGDVSPILRRNYVKPHHAGEHLCVASNPLGQTKKKFIVQVSAPPLIDGPANVDLEVRVGQPVRLECFANGLPKPDIKWTVKHTPDWDIIGDGRILKAFNISLSSEGVYTCKASNKAGVATKTFNVSVLEPPTMPTVSVNVTDKEEKPDSSGNISLQSGSNITLICNSGNPPSSVSWIRNGVIVSNASETKKVSELFIQNLQNQDSGKYTCLAKNKAGTEESDINIDVLFLPEILNDVLNEMHISYKNVSEKKWRNIETFERQTVKMECRAFGNPIPYIYWFKDKKPLGFYDSNMVKLNHGQTLLINKVSREHKGNYTCVAKNSQGKDKMNFNVDVWVSPYIEEQKDAVSQNFVLNKGETIHMECPITSNPVSKIRWMKHPYFEILTEDFPKIQLKDENKTLILQNVTVADNGNYSCIGTNIVGSVEMTFSLEVVEAPMFIEQQLDDKKSNHYPNGTVIIKIRRGFQLVCNAMAHPEPEVTWLKDGFELHNTIGAGPVHISQDGRFLNVMEAGLDSAGRYVCNAHNKVGSVVKVFHVKVLVPAEWGHWSQWSECSVSCGPGFSSRTRECQFHGNVESIGGLPKVLNDEPVTYLNSTTALNDTGESEKPSGEKNNFNRNNKGVPDELLDKSSCRGNATETRECFIAPCKVDGGWSPWGEWTSCSVACGPGSRRRYRSCSAPRPEYGGALCLGADAQQEPCQGTTCSLWLPWSAWSECSVSCGQGLKTRSRKCDGPLETCLGQIMETVPCSLSECPGEWGEWSDWSPCTVTCGNGQTRRWRECRGNDCIGGNLQIEKCFEIPVSCYKNDKINKKNEYAGTNNKAHLSIYGNLNGYKLPNKYVETDILEKNGRHYVQASINDVISEKSDYLPYMSFIIAPEVMEEKSEEALYKSSPRARGGLRMLPSMGSEYDDEDDSQIQFATGEKVRIHHRNLGVSETGDVMVDIIIEGNTPDYKNIERYTKPETRQIAPQTMMDRRYPPPMTVLRVNTCTVGYTYNDKTKQCQDVNECDTPQNSCHSTQMCENIPGSYHCLCQSGFMSVGIGQRCLDINECLQSHGCSHECLNTAGTYRCACPRNFKLTWDQRTCVKDDSLETLQLYKVTEATKQPFYVLTTSRPAPRPSSSIPSPSGYSSEDEEIILLTHISPKGRGRPPQMRRPHNRHHTDNDYDYKYEKDFKHFSPINYDEGADYYEGEERQRFSKQSKWHTVTEAPIEDEKDIYGSSEGSSPQIEPLDSFAKSRLESLLNFKKSEREENNNYPIKKSTPRPTTNKKNRNRQTRITLYGKNPDENVKKSDVSEDDSYEDEDSTIFDDNCPEGFYMDNEKCADIDECSMDMNTCNGITNSCMNTRGSYTCVPTPCPDVYKRNTDGSCEKRCDVRDSMCSEGAALAQNVVYIIVSTSVQETSVPGAIFSLQYGGKANNTKYSLLRQPAGENFYVTTDETKGTLYSSTISSCKRIHRIIIESRSYEEKGNKLLYYTKFIIYLYISS